MINSVLEKVLKDSTNVYLLNNHYITQIQTWFSAHIFLLIKLGLIIWAIFRWKLVRDY